MMSGRGRGRGFISGGGRDWRGREGAPPPSPGADRGLTSGEGSADRRRAPPVADGEEKRKSDVISPLLPVDGVGRLREESLGGLGMLGLVWWHLSPGMGWIRG